MFPLPQDPLCLASVDEVVIFSRQEAENHWKRKKIVIKDSFFLTGTQLEIRRQIVICEASYD